MPRNRVRGNSRGALSASHWLAYPGLARRVLIAKCLAESRSTAVLAIRVLRRAEEHRFDIQMPPRYAVVHPRRAEERRFDLQMPTRLRSPVLRSIFGPPPPGRTVGILQRYNTRHLPLAVSRQAEKRRLPYLSSWPASWCLRWCAERA